MPKRKLQNLKDGCVDDVSARQSVSGNEQCSEETASEVIDSGRDVPDLAIPEPSTSLPADEGSKNVIGRARTSQNSSMAASSVWSTVSPLEDDQHNGTRAGIIAQMTIPKDAERYNMTHSKRGTCLVFNQEEFDREEKREGSSFDVTRIEATFGQLGFDVVVHDNFKYSEVTKKIKRLSKLDHTDNDCVCVFVLTHGGGGGSVSAKDRSYSADKIWKPFTADNCPTLAGKPKLFFFQACRGKKSDHGVKQVEHCQTRHQTDHCIEESNSYTLPAFSDFLIGHSAPDGYESWRMSDKGTWYVQTLCEVLDEFSANTNLLDMLTITARTVAIHYKSQTERKQVPSLTSTLTRDLYFTPK